MGPVTNLWTQNQATIQKWTNEHQKNCYRSKSQKTAQLTYATEEHTWKAYLIQSHYLELIKNSQNAIIHYLISNGLGLGSVEKQFPRICKALNWIISNTHTHTQAV